MMWRECWVRKLREEVWLEGNVHVMGGRPHNERQLAMVKTHCKKTWHGVEEQAI